MDNLFEPIQPPEISDDLAKQYEAILNADYPIPDPASDYAHIWPNAIALQRQAQKLIAHLDNQKTASAESDQDVRDKLKAIAQLNNEIMRLLN